MAAKIKFIKKFWNGFKRFGENIALIVNSFLLFFVYFIGIGASVLIAKLLKKKFLDIEKKESYWQTLNLSKKEEEYYYRQF
jgi:hypothetical protein